MSVPSPLQADLRPALQAALARLPAGPCSITLGVAHLDLDRPPAGTAAFTFWGQPQAGHYRLGVGRSLTPPAGPWPHLDPDATGIGPHAFVARAFAPVGTGRGLWVGFPDQEQELPELLIEQQDGRAALTFSTEGSDRDSPASLIDRWVALAGRTLAGLRQAAAPPPCAMRLHREEELPERATWLARTQAAAEAIRRGDLDKLVLSRRLSLRGERPFDPAGVIAHLSCLYPGCTLFAVRRGPSTLVAATPERLVRLQGDRVESTALAGTARRHPSPAEDRRLADAMRADPKLRLEHRLVLDAVLGALGPLCTDLRTAERPETLALRALRHLNTPVSGRVRSGVGLLDLAAALHPTPAVSGWPPGPVLAGYLAQEEPRGWYSGYAGWVAPSGEGELSVLLRCALLKEDRAHLFAGCGIVAGSDPEAELEETELKFAALWPALENG